MSLTAHNAERILARWAGELHTLPPRERVDLVRRRQRQIKRDLERAPTPGIRARLNDARLAFDAIASTALNGARNA